VNSDALIRETQQSAGPSDGMNLVWWIPVEFWATTLAQKADLGGKERDDFVRQWNPTCW